MNKKKKMIICFVLGMVGCLCFGGGDWLMIYGNTAHTGEIYWLTQGVIGISSGKKRNCYGACFSGYNLLRNRTFRNGRIYKG